MKIFVLRRFQRDFPMGSSSGPIESMSDIYSSSVLPAYTGSSGLPYDSDISMSVAHAAMLDCERASILASGGFDD